MPHSGADGVLTQAEFEQVVRSVTAVVATSDAPAACKALADYVCDGTNDVAQVQAAIDAQSAFSGYVKVVGTTLYAATKITLDVSRCTLDMEGVNISYTGTGVCLDINNGALGYQMDSNTVKVGAIIAGGAAVASATATGLHMRGVINAWVRMAIHDFKAGTAVELESDNAVGDYVESTQFWLNIRNCKIGVKLTGDDSLSYNHFRKFTYAISDEAMSGCIAVDAQNNTFDGIGWIFDEFYLWPYTTNPFSGIKGANLIDTKIHHAFVDSLDGAHGDAFVMLDGADPSIVIDRYDLIQCNAAGQSPLAYQTQHYDNETRVPTVGWTTDDTSVGNSIPGPMIQIVHTTVGASERGLSQVTCGFLDEGVAYSSINWGKAKCFIFDIMVAGSDAECTRRFQIKPAAGEGVLAAVGLAIEVQNLALFGETYGAARATLTLNTTLTQYLTYQIMIVHYPGSRVAWYVNGVLKGTYTTVANIPSGTVATNYLVQSIINGVTGTVDDILGVGNIKILPRR